MNPIGSIHAMPGATVPRALDPAAPDARQAELQRLRGAVADFEGLFIAHMLKAMQNTVPQAQKGLFSGGDVLRDVGWEKVAESMARKGGLGLGEMLYESLKGKVSGDPAAADADPTTVPGLGNQPDPARTMLREPASPRPIDHIRETATARPLLDAASHLSDKRNDGQSDPMP